MFRLSRYYSIASLIGIALVIVALSIFFRHLAVETLMDHQTRANVDLTKSFANSIWHDIADFVTESSNLSLETLSNRPELTKLDTIVKQQMKGINVVKVKIYNLVGTTVFSTDPNDIGQNKIGNSGFLQAKSGRVASEITFRNQFYAFEQRIVDRNLIASYIPIHTQDNGPVTAVFEVYSDVTTLVENINATQIKITSGVFAALAGLYLFLFIIVRHADRIMTFQEQQRLENEEHLRHQAQHDSLTGLPNRLYFAERFQDAIQRAKRHNKQGALLFLDLDRFKLINDSLGHDAGDQLLRITAARIQKSLRETDLSFRMSGDEFTIILEDLDKPEDAAQTARRIIEAMDSHISLNGYEVIINVSIGITTFPKPGFGVETLVQEADAAMYRAKQTGHNRYEFFTEEMNTTAFARLALETDLQKALQNNQFAVYYQSKVDTFTHELMGAEALLRWQHPNKGIIPPNLFIPHLEDTGLINAVGEWVIHTACLQAKAWQDAGLKPIRISVNISAKQFRNQNLVNVVRGALEKSALPAQYLELELTESMFIDNTEHAINTMQELKKLGVALSIDDFGSGYSSLGYLKNFPIDYLKIDRSFIKDLHRNPSDAAITTAISALAHSLNLGLVAEGVEEESQLEFLKAQGCQEVQGFLFSKPINGHEFETSILKRAWKKTG